MPEMQSHFPSRNSARYLRMTTARVRPPHPTPSAFLGSLARLLNSIRHTWEPEENLPPLLVNEYRKRVAAGNKSEPRKRMKTSAADVEEQDEQPSLLSQLLNSREKKKRETQDMKERINKKACS